MNRESKDELRKLFVNRKVERPEVVLPDRKPLAETFEKATAAVDEFGKALGGVHASTVKRLAELDELAARGASFKSGRFVRLKVRRNADRELKKIEAIKWLRELAVNSPDKDGITSSLKDCKTIIENAMRGRGSFMIQPPAVDPEFIANFTDRMHDCGFVVYRLISLR
jgi:hypothetical protein